MISVLLADEQDLIRIGLRTLIAATDGFTMTGEAPDGLAAVEAAISTQPDVVLMDIRMPGIDGLEGNQKDRRGDGPDPDPGDRAHHPHPDPRVHPEHPPDGSAAPPAWESSPSGSSRSSRWLPRA